MIVFKSLIHEMDLTAMEQRRRVVRNVDGQIMTSYRDLFNPRPARRQTRRTSKKEIEIALSLITQQKTLAKY